MITLCDSFLAFPYNSQIMDSIIEKYLRHAEQHKLRTKYLVDFVLKSFFYRSELNHVMKWYEYFLERGKFHDNTY